MTFVCSLIWFSQLISWSVKRSVGYLVSRMVGPSSDWPVEYLFVFIRSLVLLFVFSFGWFVDRFVFRLFVRLVVCVFLCSFLC